MYSLSLLYSPLTKYRVENVRSASAYPRYTSIWNTEHSAISHVLNTIDILLLHSINYFVQLYMHYFQSMLGLFDLQCSYYLQDLTHELRNNILLIITIHKIKCNMLSTISNSTFFKSCIPLQLLNLTFRHQAWYVGILHKCEHVLCSIIYRSYLVW